MNLHDQQALFAKDVAKLIVFIFEQGFSCSLGEAYRTPEQAAIYAKEGKGIVDSLHCKKLAIDLNLFDNKGMYLATEEPYEVIGKYWESLSPVNRWGGNFPRKDADHFERNAA